jgi:outer membrane protein insertion porin family
VQHLRNNLRLRFLLFWFPFLFCSYLSFGESRGTGVVTAIEIRGNKKIEKAAIRERIVSRVGASFSKEVVREDIRAIFGLGFFEDIEVNEEPSAGGLKLIYLVREKPIVVKIEYEGLESIEKEDTKELIKVKEFEVLDIAKINDSVEKLIQKYEEKGFYLADVHYEIERDSQKNEATVIFRIQENDKIQVKNINIIGNSVLSDSELKGIMQTQEGGAFSWLSGSGSYREAVFERDIAGLGYYYGTKGYIRARFGKPEVTVSPDKKWVYITFFVDEGKQYRVGKVDFQGDILYRRDELMADLELKEGEIFNTEVLRRETLKYTEKYSDLGYAFANVVPQPQIHDDTRVVDITFEVDRGERVYIGEITVTGNTRTKDKVVRRELLIHEGELYNGSKKRESRENVVRLGYFDSVEFHQSSSKKAPNLVDIEIRIKERSTGQLVIGAGYSTGPAGFLFNAQLSQNNFLGNGQIASLSAQLQTGNGRSEYNLSFQEPFVGASRWSLGGSLYQLRRDVIYLIGNRSYSEIKTGADVKLGHPIREFTNLYLTYRFEHSYVSDIIDTSIFKPDQLNGNLSSITANVVYDKRDDRFDPRQGLYWSASSELAGLGFDRHFLRSTGTVRFYHPVIWDFIFRLNVTGANISPTTDRPVPVNELYILGGLFSLRGYAPMSVGPKANLATTSPPLSSDALANSLGGKQIVVGGTNQAYLNAEIEFPILKEARVRGVVFFDAGNSFNDLKNTDPKILANYGYGIRWFTPIGPLRFEFGHPIVNGGSPQFIFTIGPAF